MFAQGMCMNKLDAESPPSIADLEALQEATDSGKPAKGGKFGCIR